MVRYSHSVTEATTKWAYTSTFYIRQNKCNNSFHETDMRMILIINMEVYRPKAIGLLNPNSNKLTQLEVM